MMRLFLSISCAHPQLKMQYKHYTSTLLKKNFLMLYMRLFQIMKNTVNAVQCSGWGSSTSQLKLTAYSEKACLLHNRKSFSGKPFFSTM